MTTSRSVGHAAEAWLPLLPADARTFRVTDRRLAEALRLGGGEPADSSPDVEIVARASEVRSDARVAVVSLGRPGWRRGALPARIAARARASVRVRAEAALAERALRASGYAVTETVTWDLGHPFRRAGRPRPGSAVERLPQCALVLGHREPPGISLLDAVLAEAGAGPCHRLTARGGMLLAFCERSLVRVAVGPGRRQIEAGLAALDTLRAADPPDEVAGRVPWPGARGETGLAAWSAEPLLPGARPAEPPAECVDFLVALQPVGGPGAGLAAAAALVAGVCPEAERARVEAAARRVEADLEDVPRAFGHGDFWTGNLLVAGRLAGVVDWDSAGPGRLAGLDLLHLIVTSRWPALDLRWGPAIVGELLPWARGGGDELMRGYCERVGMEPDPRLLESLAIAYWLDRAASQLATHAEHWDDRDWIEANVLSVARSLPVA